MPGFGSPAENPIGAPFFIPSTAPVSCPCCGNIDTVCCPDRLLPRTLFGTMTDISGGACSCSDNLSFLFAFVECRDPGFILPFGCIWRSQSVVTGCDPVPFSAPSTLFLQWTLVCHPEVGWQLISGDNRQDLLPTIPGKKNIPCGGGEIGYGVFGVGLLGFFPMAQSCDPFALLFEGSDSFCCEDSVAEPIPSDGRWRLVITE